MDDILIFAIKASQMLKKSQDITVTSSQFHEDSSRGTLDVDNQHKSKLIDSSFILFTGKWLHVCKDWLIFGF